MTRLLLLVALSVLFAATSQAMAQRGGDASSSPPNASAGPTSIPTPVAIDKSRTPALPADPIVTGSDRYAEAIELAKPDPIRSRSLFAESAAAFEAAIAASPSPSGELYRAAGNAHVLAGQTGRAVLAFRRALAADPSNTRAADGLKIARASLSVEAPDSTTTRFLDAINIWPRYVSVRIMQVVFVLTWAAVWSAVLVSRTLHRRPPPSTLVVVSIMALASGLALTAKWIDDRMAHDVVVLDPITAYNGPSEEVYEPTFESPLAAGMEAQLRETRGDWSQIELRNGTRTWVRSQAIESVRPRVASEN